MRDSGMTGPERRVQPRFRFPMVLQMFMLAGAILGARVGMAQLPNREELGLRVSTLRYESVSLDLNGSDIAPFKLTGAWVATSPDPRFGGLSGLEVDEGKLLAVGDTGTVLWLDKPGPTTTVTIKELPGGPGDPGFKKNRDAEAVRADPGGRGWWVPFERVNQLWLYDRSFSRSLRRIDFGEDRWPPNEGVEGLVADRRQFLMFVEGGETIYRLRSSGVKGATVKGKQGAYSEAVRHPDGQLLALERSLGSSGLRNRLALLDETAQGFRPSRTIRLPVGPFDNMEGMAVERSRDGTTRLWIIADDNFQRPMRTLLIALDLPPEGRRP